MATERRLAELEKLVQQQQGQLEHLSSLVKDLGVRLRYDLETLRGDHSLLCAEGRALGHCLLGAGIVQASEIRSRTQACWAFSLLRSAVSFEHVSSAIAALADGTGQSAARLALASQTLSSLRVKAASWRSSAAVRNPQVDTDEGARADADAAAAADAEAEAWADAEAEVDARADAHVEAGADVSAAAVARAAAGPAREELDARPPKQRDLAACPCLDERAWCKLLIDKEPSEASLDRWARSAAVRHILGSYVVEDRVGIRDMMKFSDAYCVFNDMGLSLDQFVRHFSFEGGPHSARRDERQVTEMASCVLRKCVSQYVEEADSIKFRDLYRLLELIGYPLSRFCSRFTDRNPQDPGPLHCGRRPLLGSYRLSQEIGGGAAGMCCYMGEHVQTAAKVAVKWPAKSQELDVLKAIHRHSGGRCLGVALLLDTGVFEGEHYMVTELLGSSFTKVFARLQQGLESLEQRWGAICLIGRMLVRRLQALHECGYVHCDISPDNVLLGHAWPSPHDKPPRFAPYLIDFGLARRYPGGGAMGGEFGSAEWNSIRSADNGERRPEDDLESVGWLMVTGLCGTLPWVDWLSQAYGDWDSQQMRSSVLKQVQQAKLQLLEDGWDSLGWAELEQVPIQLDNYIKECRLADESSGPDYSYLLALLGCNPDLNMEEAEEQDLVLFGETVVPLL